MCTVYSELERKSLLSVGHVEAARPCWRRHPVNTYRHGMYTTSRRQIYHRVDQAQAQQGYVDGSWCSAEQPATADRQNG
jgi:hypothetical protein